MTGVGVDISIVVDRTGGLHCRRCGRELLLAVQVPTTMSLPTGDVVCLRTVELCPHCDRDDRPAQGVLAYFAVYGRIERATVDDAAPVLREWLVHIAANPPTYSDADLDDEIQRWQAGEM